VFGFDCLKFSSRDSNTESGEVSHDLSRALHQISFRPRRQTEKSSSMGSSTIHTTKEVDLIATKTSTSVVSKVSNSFENLDLKTTLVVLSNTHLEFKLDEDTLI